MTNEQLRMQMLAGIITEGEYKAKLNELKSWDDIDREIEQEREMEESQKEEYVNTPQGKNAVNQIKRLINNPYGNEDLSDVLEILNIPKQKFIWAAKEAGMSLTTGGGGIRISDPNYKDPDVSIDYIGGEWFVG